MPIFEWIFWIAVAFSISVNIGYPAMLQILSLFKKHKITYWETKPKVTMIISAYNEDIFIKKKLENALNQDYPSDKLEIIVASDGSTDGTNEIVMGFQDQGVKLHAHERLGKTGVQNESVKQATGEVIVFSDSNAMYREDAISKLIRNFGDNRIGCVCGQLQYQGDTRSPAGLCEISYWNYEKFIKRLESRLSSLIGVNGSIYAIRKSDYVEINNHLISDLVEPLEIVKRGKRVIYEPEAISIEQPSASYEEEFERKVRILTRSIDGFLHMKTLLNPLRYGFFSVQLWFHKILRYLVPFFLAAATLSLIFLTHQPFYYVIYCLVITALVFAAIARFTEGGQKSTLLFSLIYYYLKVNFALTLAWINILKGKKITLWATDRDSIKP
jgi:cellulose synthase/poly-beta-1,6-N-acetylglucosamine synthase-like glycosyltransferase